jgi:hypothetical protein
MAENEQAGLAMDKIRVPHFWHFVRRTMPETARRGLSSL